MVVKTIIKHLQILVLSNNFYFLLMTITGLEPGGYLEVMLQQVCEYFFPPITDKP